MAPHLTLSCLGSPLVRDPAGEPLRFRTRKHLALLVRLAVEPGKRLTREYLTELLWPDAPARLAAHSLAQALSVIRAKVGRERLLVQRTGVGLAEGAVDVDLHHLDQCDVEIRGTFLEGFDLPAARPFEDWTDEWRARLLPRIRDCLVRQMDAGRRLGDFATVERHAQVLYEIDPLSEDAVRGIIEARAWVGDRTNALKAFAAYEARLVEELGAKPGPELQRMANLLREGRPSSRPQPRAVGEPGERAERRFEPETLIGREREFSVLYDAWLAARQRKPGIVVLTGDPGLGKTTLANAFASTCQLEGAVIARAQAYDAERELPFAVLSELVRQLAIQRAIGCADPEALSELTRLTPEVAAQFPGVPKPLEWAAEIVPLRLADAFVKTVAAAAEESPVVLVVDDVHAADNASAAILHIVARKLPPARLLVILAARSAELRASGAPGALTSDPAIEALRAIDLEPLPDDAAARLIQRSCHTTGDGAPELPLDRILRAGRGNPLALELLTREWVTQGPESLLRDLEAMNTQPAAAIGIPRAIKAVFERQVARLDRKTRSVLDLAAVLGRRLADLSLYRAVDCTPAEAAEAFGRLRDEGFVREVHGDIEFRNELIRAQAYYAIPAAGRQHLHRSVGELLASSRQDRAKAALETAWHFLRAGDSERAAPYALSGAELSRSVGAPLEAEEILHALLARLPGAQVSLDVHLVLVRALLDQSKAGDAIPHLQVILGDPTISVDMRAEASVLLATAEYLLNRFTGRLFVTAAEGALEAAAEAGNGEILLKALFEYARAGSECGNEGMVATTRQRIQDLVSSDRAIAESPRAHLTLAYCHWYFYDAGRALESLQRAQELLVGSTDLPLLCMCHSGVGVAMSSLGESDAALNAFLQALQFARKTGDDSRASIIASNICTVHSHAGRFEEAIRYGRLAIEYGRRAPTQPGMGAVYTNLIDPYWLTGRPQEAIHALEMARRWVQDKEPNWYSRAGVLCEGAGLALMQGNHPLALAQIAALEREGKGGERSVPLAGFYQRLRIFRAAHEHGLDVAFEMAHAAEEAFRGLHPQHYLDVVTATAWLEKKAHRTYPARVIEAVDWCAKAGMRGRLAVIVAQGFLEPQLTAGIESRGMALIP
ncbi:MAG TPA: AAA family ATPase [Gemmatimonadales bacterium]|nr:AAA family ATPase [Gemmatimonadales bacterium]